MIRPSSFSLAMAWALRRPSCTDCHPGHEEAAIATTGNRAKAPDRCGNCHANQSQLYRESLHGELTQLGYEAAATCSDCHGSHEILKIDDPASQLSPANRVQTCQQCHPNATQAFTEYIPHANHMDGKHYPALHMTFVFMTFVLMAFVLMERVRTCWATNGPRPEA